MGDPRAQVVGIARPTASPGASLASPAALGRKRSSRLGAAATGLRISR